MSGSSDKCCAEVWQRHSMRPYCCGAKAKVERDGKFYCGRHDPVASAAKAAARATEFDKEWSERKRKFALEGAAADLLSALKALVCDHGGTWRVGASDPKAIAARAAIAKAEAAV